MNIRSHLYRLLRDLYESRSRELLTVHVLRSEIISRAMWHVNEFERPMLNDGPELSCKLFNIAYIPQQSPSKSQLTRRRACIQFS